MLECVVIAKDLAYRGRVNAATIENDAWCVEKQGVFVAKVKYRKLQPEFVAICRINGWSKCRY